MKTVVRIVYDGDRYGLRHCLVHHDAGKNDPLVEFYDGTYAGQDGFDPEGQFVSRYYLSTLLEGASGLLTTGLYLGDDPSWRVPAAEMRGIVAQLQQVKRDLAAGARGE